MKYKVGDTVFYKSPSKIQQGIIHECFENDCYGVLVEIDKYRYTVSQVIFRIPDRYIFSNEREVKLDEIKKKLS